MSATRVDDVAALLRSAAIKKRLEGATLLAELLHAHASGELHVAPEDLTALLPDVLPCLRDHNAKVVRSALESLDIILAHAPVQTAQSYFKVLWLNLVEKLGDSKLAVREKAVDVAAQLANVLDVATVLERLLPCAQHKNWRTRESTLRCIWRCLDAHDLVVDLKDDVLSHIVQLLEDSAKEVRDVAIETLELFYSRIGPSLLRDLEAKNIRSAQMKVLTDRFRSISNNSRNNSSNTQTTARSVVSSGIHTNSNNALETTTTAELQPESLTSILSSYEPMTSSSSSSMARYLESLRQRERDAAAAAATTNNDDHNGRRSPSQLSTASGSSGVSNNDDNMTDRDVHRDVATVNEQLNLALDWSKRVDALKSLQKLTTQLDRTNDTTALASLALALKSARERLCDQVADLRSSVSREACATIQLLARVLRDDFNAHAEVCLGPLLKATYVTIQVISTAADTCIRGVIASTKNGYVRFIPKLLEGAKSRNQVLRLHCVSYLTLTLQQWSVAHLSKHADLFLAILPAILHDALAEVRAQSRKCFWALQRVFPTEGNALLERLDASTQKNLRDDRARLRDNSDRAALDTATSRAFEPFATTAHPGGNGNVASRKGKSNRPLAYDAAAVKENSASTTTTTTTTTTTMTIAAQRVVQHATTSLDGTSSSSSSKQQVARGNGPRRVLGVSATSDSASTDAVTNSSTSNDKNRAPSRVPMQRIGSEARLRATSTAASDDTVGERKRQPLRVPSSSDMSAALAAGPPSSKKGPDVAVFASRQTDASTTTLTSSASFHKRIQIDATLSPLPPQLSASLSSTSSQSSSSRADPTSASSSERIPRRVPGLSPHSSSTQLLTAARIEAASNTSTTSSTTSTTVGSKPQSKALAKVPSRAAAPVAKTTPSDALDDALSRLTSSSWSTRLDAIEVLGSDVQRRAAAAAHGRTAATGAATLLLDDRVVRALVKHVSDAHYRVAHAALKSCVALLQVASPTDVQPQLKPLLPKLFQKLIETKESVRALARASLDTVAKRIDASTLVALTVPMLLDRNSNMKVRAAVCHYVRELLPRADAYMTHATASSSHMRAFLAKLAQLLESDMPVTVTTAASELLLATATLYSSEFNMALQQLPPPTRSALTRVLKAKGVVLQLSQSAASDRLTASTPSSSASTSIRTNGPPPAVTQLDTPSDNQMLETTATERSSRKRSESPNANSGASPQRTVQKRIGATAISSHRKLSSSTNESPVARESPPLLTSSIDAPVWCDESFEAAARARVARVSATSVDNWLDVLADNNTTDDERRRVLQKVLAFAKLSGADDVWDHVFNRMLLLLLDASAEHSDMMALRVLQGVVEAQPVRSSKYAELLLERLLASLDDSVDMASHITESILHAIVTSSSHASEQMLTILAPYVTSAAPPVLQVVLRLVTAALGVAERAARAGDTRGFYVREPQWRERLFVPITTRLAHISSDVRRCAVQCVVAFHFAVNEDTERLWESVRDDVSATRMKIVEIFVERAKLERRGQVERRLTASSS